MTCEQTVVKSKDLSFIYISAVWHKMRGKNDIPKILFFLFYMNEHKKNKKHVELSG